MNDKELALLERLIGTLGANTSATIDSYVVWHVASALWWTMVGAGFVYGAWMFLKRKPESWDPVLHQLACVVLTFVGILFLGSNMPDLAAPRAIAIHQLLNDIVP